MSSAFKVQVRTDGNSVREHVGRPAMITAGVFGVSPVRVYLSRLTHG